ncbi:MAG: protein BatD [Nitrospinae bacterium]|nr:protein BatD [Nitrospinota bacterium]
MIQANFSIKSIVLTFLIYAALTLPAWGEEVQVLATVDRNEITLEDSLLLSITIRGTQNTPPPELPSLPDFRIASSGTSSSTQIINMSRSVSITHNYRLTPMNTGQFKIGSARVRANGKTYATQPIAIVVKKPTAPGQSGNRPVFVESAVSKKEAFVGEQLIYTFKLFHRVEAKNFDLNMPFGSTYFQKEELGKAKSYQSVINGIQYHVQEVSVALFPIKPGKAEIPAAILEFDIYHRTKNRSNQGPFGQFFNDPFFSQTTRTEHKVLRTKPLSLEILPLPEKGKPKDFKNTIGQFQMDASLGKNDLEVGDTTTLTITVSGKGNVKGISFPEPELKNLFKVYPDQPEAHQTVTGNQITGKKVFKFALVPLKPGPTNLPAFTLSYFDPTSRNYRQIKTQPITINVRPSSTQENLNLVQSNPLENSIGKPEIEILAEDILPLHTQLDDFQNIETEINTRTIFEFVSPALFFLISAFLIRHKKRLTSDVAFYRSQKAYKIANEKLKNLTHSQNKDSRVFASELSEILREYIGDKLNLEGKAITATEVEHKLKASDYPVSQADSTRKLLEKCEALQYAPESSGNNVELLNESQDLIKTLEKES